MTNPFLKPHTLSEWLRSSLCWTGACLGTWWLGWMLLDNLVPKTLNSLVLIGMPVSFCVVHALIWWRAVAGGRALIRHDEQHYAFSRTRLAANLWLAALMLFQVACLLGPFIMVGLLVLGDTSAKPSVQSISNEPFFK